MPVKTEIFDSSTLIAFFRFPYGFEALAVTRHLRNPDRFVVQLFNYAFEMFECLFGSIFVTTYFIFLTQES